jgi:hypothetical protein
MDCFRSLFLFFPRILNADSRRKAKALKAKPSKTAIMGQQGTPAGGSRKISFNVSDQYEIQDVIGEGAYGVVW